MQGRIRNWLLVGDGVLVFNIRGNRFCRNVGRAHKSNGIYVVGAAYVYCMGCFVSPLSSVLLTS